MPRYTRQATEALSTYRALVHMIRDLSPADRRSFERGLVDIGEAVQYEEGPLRDEVGIGDADLHLHHYDALDAMLDLSNYASRNWRGGPGIENLVEARQSRRRRREDA